MKNRNITYRGHQRRRCRSICLSSLSHTKSWYCTLIYYFRDNLKLNFENGFDNSVELVAILLSPFIHSFIHSFFQVKALYEYEPTRPDELHINEGDVIDIFRNDDPEWWFGGLVDGSQGYFPSNYVTEIKRHGSGINFIGEFFFIILKKFSILQL